MGLTSCSLDDDALQWRLVVALHRKARWKEEKLAHVGWFNRLSEKIQEALTEVALDLR